MKQRRRQLLAIAFVSTALPFFFILLPETAGPLPETSESDWRDGVSKTVGSESGEAPDDRAGETHAKAVPPLASKLRMRAPGESAAEPVSRESLVERHYSGAARLSVRERGLPGGELERITLLRTDLKYPLVRVVDRLGAADAAGERALLRSVAMAAGHWLVDPAEGVNDAELRARLASAGWRVRAALPQSGHLLVAPAGEADVAAGAEDGFATGQTALARDLSGIAGVEPDWLYYPSGLADDPSFVDGSLWGLRNTGQAGGTAGADISAVEAWDIRNDASNVVVAVIDTGVRMTHEDLAANLWTNPGEIAGNGIDDDGNGVIDDVHGFDAIDGGGAPDDADGHGTHVAGTVGAAGNNATGVTGVAWQVQLMPVRFLGANGGFLSDAIEGIAYARNNGATILNNSWGGGGFSTTLRNAIAELAADDILFVAAAGNDGVDADLTPGYPAAYELDHIVSVAASDRNDNRAGFSNFGAESVDLAAPGASIRSTFNGGDASYASLSGTSMASPQVAGAAALLRAAFPGEDALSIKARLLETVDPTADFLTTTVSGGRLNLEAALLNEAVPRPGVLRFDTNQISVAEDGGVANLRIVRVGGSDGAVSVGYRTVDGSAVAGADFGAISDGSLSWADGDDSDRLVSVSLLDDTDIEGTETFEVELFGAGGGAVLGTPERQEVRLLDNEAAPLAGFDFASANEVVANFVTTEPAPVLAATPDGGHVLAEIEFVGGSVQLLLRRFDAAGALLWERNRLSGGGVWQPQVTVAADGRIYVGYSRITLDGSFQITEADLAAMAFTGDGNLLWDAALPDPSGAFDLVNAVAVGEDGGVYLGGEYAFFGADDAFVARLDAATGNFSWIRTFKPNPDFDGDDAVSALAPAAGGGVWAGGWTVGNNGFEGVLRRYNATGGLLLARRLPTLGQQRVLDLEVNAFGEIYLSMRAFDNATGAFSGKLLRVEPATGETVWERTQAIGSGAANFLIAPDPNGRIDYIQGPFQMDGSSAYSVGRFDRGGERLFENNLNANASLSVTGMAGTTGGGLVFAGAFNGLAQFGGTLLDSGGQNAAYQARLLLQDPLQPGSLAFEAEALAVSEAIGALPLVISREGGGDGAVSVGLRTLPETALAGEDFLAIDTIVDFSPGQLSATVPLTVLDDFVVEPEESLQVELFDPAGGAALGPPAQITLRLLNDDFAFEEWLGGFFEPGAPAAGETADPDADGLVNLLEYAFGLDPLEADGAPPQAVAPDGAGTLRFTYQRQAGRGDLRFDLRLSPDLVEWFAPTSVAETTEALPGGREAVTLEAEAPFDVEEKAFVRLEVERSSQSIGGELRGMRATSNQE